MFALVPGLALAGLNLCLASAFAIPYSARLNDLADLGLLAAGIVAFVALPVKLGERWVLRRRRMLEEVDPYRVLPAALLLFNVAAASALGFLTPRSQLVARAKWLPSRLGVIASTALKDPQAPVEPAPAAGAPSEGAEARPPNAAETEMLGYINEARRARGLRPLKLHPGIAAVAQGWAATMAAKRQATHHVAGAFGDHAHAYHRHYPPGARGSGENVAMSVSVKQIFDGMFYREQDARGNCLPDAAGGHCRNILDPRFNVIGIGDVMRGPYHFHVQNFGIY